MSQSKFRVTLRGTVFTKHIKTDPDRLIKTFVQK